MKVTPQIRWKIHECMEHLDRTTSLRIALNIATYWESFPKSYSREQVEAAEELMVAYYEYMVEDLHDGHIRRLMAARDAVRELMD